MARRKMGVGGGVALFWQRMGEERVIPDKRLGGYGGRWEMGTKLGGEGWEEDLKPARFPAAKMSKEQCEAAVPNRNVRWRLIQREIA